MITIKRKEYPTHCSGSAMMPDGSMLYTLEPPNLDNKPFVSCIPYGQYLNEHDYTGKHRYYKVLEVEGRTNIEHHPATKAEQLEGCIAWSMEPTDCGLTERSREACETLLSWFGNYKWAMEIIRDEPI